MISESKLLITICVPIYGVEKYIERCAVSLFEQTYNNIEYIFVDDCSPDKSVEVLQNVMNRYPSRLGQVRLIRHPENKGLGEARNTAVREAKGDYILHVDSDDYIDTDVVSKLTECQSHTNADIICYPKRMIYKDRIVVEKQVTYPSPRAMLNDILLCKISGNIWGKLILTSLYRDNNIQVEGGVNQSEDFQVISRLLYYAKNIAYIDTPYYNYDHTLDTSYTNSMTKGSFRQVRVTQSLLVDFFQQKGCPDLVQLMWVGATIAHCRSKIKFAKDKNWKMFDYLSLLVDEEMSYCNRKVPIKQKIIASVKNHCIFSLLVRIIGIGSVLIHL